jgi:hypothetical protein
MPRKSALISLTLNRGSQQLNNFVIIKYERVTAWAQLATKADRIIGPRGGFSVGHAAPHHCGSPARAPKRPRPAPE